VDQVARSIHDPARVTAALAEAREPSVERVRELVGRARQGEGLCPEEVAALLHVEDPTWRNQVLAAAREIRERYYARRISVSAPVCPTNRCVNECLYCPMRRSNSRLRRRAATTGDLQREIVALLDEGYRSFTLVFGDDRSGTAYVRDAVWATFGTTSGLRQAQRVDLDINPMRPDQQAALGEAGRLGTNHVVQETYDPEAYGRLHPEGPKSDYAWRLTCHDRALESGWEQVGLGILLGLHDHRYDVVALVAHAQYLEKQYSMEPAVVSLPRLVHSTGAPASLSTEFEVDDERFCYVVAVLRLALPFYSIQLSTPVQGPVRRELYSLGVTQCSVGSLSYPGAYSGDGEPETNSTLRIGSPRALEQLVYRMAEFGFVPNLCANCAVAGRRPAGARSRCVNERCGPNSLAALKEYLLDHASPETQVLGDRLIQRELSRLPERLRSDTLDLLQEVEAGLRRQVL